MRWRIEDWHRVLKSGCRIETLQHKTAERLRRAIAINLVIAWRIMLMTLLGREQPELSAEVLFSDLEIEVLAAYQKKDRTRPTEPLIQLGNAVRLVAQIGGYLGRANDPPPGHQLMWQGYFQLQLMCEGYSLRNDQEFWRVFGVRTVKWRTTNLVAVRLGAMSLVGIRRRGHRHERRVCALGMIPPERTPHQTSLG